MASSLCFSFLHLWWSMTLIILPHMCTAAVFFFWVTPIWILYLLNFILLVQYVYLCLMSTQLYMNTMPYVRLFTACMKHRMYAKLMDFWWLFLFLLNNKYCTWLTRLRKSICGFLLCMMMALVNIWLSSCYLTDKHGPNTGTVYSNELHWLSIWINIILSV